MESCLDRWTPEILGQAFFREWAGEVQLHTRQSVLTRLVLRDAFHCGEGSLVLGMHGLASLDRGSHLPRLREEQRGPR